MPLNPVLRPGLAVAALVALGACAQEPQSATKASAAPPPAQLQTVEVPLEQRWRLSREAQLQTPLELPPEATGAPGAHHFYANGADIGRPELLAAGVNIEPDVRVWQSWPAGTRQIYGPQPSAARPILQPVVIPTR